jgi:hypothetical protein
VVESRHAGHDPSPGERRAAWRFGSINVQLDQRIAHAIDDTQARIGSRLRRAGRDRAKPNALTT